MLTRKLYAASILTALLSIPVCDASGQMVGRGFSGFDGYGVGIGGLYRTLDFPTERRVPYFAAHPPVYYSVPVPRTYGYSPFAYSPFELTPPVMPEPEVIANPHVEASAEDKSAALNPKRTDRNVSASAGKLEVAHQGPLTVVNPFVEPVAEDVEYH